ncbi:MAG: hypothetical protein FJX53_11850 [Alphaproteobacteria bacterium]|nr:hypothetical protein [Alphaproteobacteria bacterium]
MQLMSPHEPLLVKEPANLKQSVVLVAAALLSSGAVLAQTGIPTPRSVEKPAAGGVPMGPLTAYPSVSYEVQRNDNIFLQAPGSPSLVKDTIQVLKPAVRLEGRTGAHQFGFGLGFESGRYSDSSADDYNNNNAFVNLDLNRGGRVTARLNANHVDAHDPRGSTTDAATAVPNRYRQQTLGGIFGYGAPGAQGRFELELGTLDKSYTNNRASTFVNDRSDNSLGGTFYWRIAPRTQLLAQVKRTDIDFSDPASTLDSKETRYLGGVTWEATAATTGLFKIGQVRKDFNSGLRPDFNGTGWEAQVRWSPLTYSQWEFMNARAPRETAGNFGDFVLGSNYAAKWTHAWNSRFSTIANASHATDSYKGVARNDKIDTLGLKASYQMRRWLSFGGEYTWQKRDSDVDSADYKRNVFMLFLSATL